MAGSAVALMSGGLDSSLAVRLLHDMGVRIIGVHFTGPFCMCNRGKGGCISYAKQQADALGLRFLSLPLGGEYFDIVRKPKHGYGSGVNPCVDCRILMFRRAKALMDEEGASFIVTGEVLGQRPMSQLKKKLALIERESGLSGLILRPLCAQHMPVTIPEREGLVDRARLLSMKGRGRREQMDLAEKLAVGDYPCPAGGCLLTDKHFAARVRDMLAREGLELRDIGLLKIGRHFRLPGGSKLVIGRDEEENRRIETMARDNHTRLSPEEVVGPSAALREAPGSNGDLAIAAGIVASFCDGSGPVAVACEVNGRTEKLRCERKERSAYDEFRV